MKLLPGRLIGDLRRVGRKEIPRRRIDLGEEEPIYSIYAIGDIHGRLDLLTEAEQCILQDVQHTGIAGLVILLGDYVDRGPDSRGVLNHLIQPLGNRLRRIALCGNHDDLFLRFVDAPRAYASWLDLGGRDTLNSYGIPSKYISIRNKAAGEELKAKMLAAIPEQHFETLRSMPIYVRIGQYLFAHAGVRPGVPLDRQSDDDLMWIREPFLTKGPQLPIVLVHGHTPYRAPSFGPGRIGIDTGAYASGRLSVMKLYQKQINFLM